MYCSPTSFQSRQPIASRGIADNKKTWYNTVCETTLCIAPMEFLPGQEQIILIGEDELYMMQQWFKDAKLGIFMHWGLYSVRGITESWSFYNGEISYEDYMAQA